MYLFFDTETNGLPLDYNAPITNLSNWPRLVQIAWILFDNAGQEVKRKNYIIKPDGFIIPNSASSIHGITTEKALIEGKDINVVLKEFNTYIDIASKLVAHNMSFDEKIVGAEFLRFKMYNPIQEKSKICTMTETTNYVAIPGPYGYKWPKLTELHYKLFRNNFEDAHDATVDVEITAKCFWEAKKLGIIDDQLTGSKKAEEIKSNITTENPPKNENTLEKESFPLRYDGFYQSKKFKPYYKVYIHQELIERKLLGLKPERIDYSYLRKIIRFNEDGTLFFGEVIDGHQMRYMSESYKPWVFGVGSVRNDPDHYPLESSYEVNGSFIKFKIKSRTVYLFEGEIESNRIILKIKSLLDLLSNKEEIEEFHFVSV